MHSPNRRRWALSWGLLLLVLAVPALEAQQGSELEAEIERDYRVEISPGGVTLRPREAQLGIEHIAVAGSEVRVNGAKVPEPALREWLRERAGRVIALSRLSPAEQRRLFGFGVEDLEVSRPTPPELPAPRPAERPEIPEAEAPAPPAPPEPPEIDRGDLHRTGEQFTIFDDLVIERSETAREATAVMGSVTVLGEVRGDVAAINGNVRVEGRVEGEVTAVNGSVYLGPKSQVLRGVVSVNGRVDREEGAEVRGGITEVPFMGFRGRRDGHSPGWFMGWRPGPGFGGWRDDDSFFWGFFWELVEFGILALLACALFLVTPRPVRRVQTTLTREWAKAGLFGLLAFVLFVPVLVVLILGLVLTIVGCLLVVPLVIAAPILLLAAMLLGYTAVAKQVGEGLRGRFRFSIESDFGLILVGLTVLALPHLAGSLLVSIGGLLALPGWLLVAIGKLLNFVAVIFGVGAVVLTRFGTRGPEGGAPVVQEPSPQEPPPQEPPWEEPPAEEEPTYALPPIDLPPIEPAPPSEDTRPGTDGKT
ncbi:MAG TPA: polymer-forming cytoskeletal protein [Thermoanaerobaculia bacterium]|nr:polymer-forming cytoskeletal protein [Thermoanaerobaculia bacterium]